MASTFRYGFALGLLGLALILFSGAVAAKSENKAGPDEARLSSAYQPAPTPTIAPPPTATSTPVPPKPTPTLIGASSTTSSGSSSSVFLVFLALIFGGIVLAVIFSFVRLGRRR